MPRKPKQPKKVSIRLRRQSYFNKLKPYAEEWIKNTHPDLNYTFDSTIVNKYLSEEYKLFYRSSSMRKINGEKINKPGTWSVRVDYFYSYDPKLFTLFYLKFAPIIIDKTWFIKKYSL